MTEEWRPVLGYEGWYEVSSIGNVRSVERTIQVSNGRSQRTYRSRMLSGSRRNEYLVVALCQAGTDKQCAVHILVCEAFHGPRPEGLVVRHLNGQHRDNRAENLKWGTYAENSADAFVHGTAPSITRTHCKHGHEFTPENTSFEVRRGYTSRRCKACARRHCAPANARRKAARRRHLSASAPMGAA